MNFKVSGVFQKLSKMTDTVAQTFKAFDNSLVISPAIPYVGNFPFAVGHGTTVLIQGTMRKGKFAINLQTGSGNMADVAFHFNVRANENCVVRNSRLNGNWGSEERHGGFPFRTTLKFEVEINICKKNIKVKVDGKNFCDFKHRLDIHNISTLAVNGEVTVHNIRFLDKDLDKYGFDDCSDNKAGDSLKETAMTYPQPAGFSPGNQPSPCPQPAGSYPGSQPSSYPQPDGSYPGNQASSYPQPAGFSPGNQPPPCPQPAGSYPGNQPSSYPQPAGFSSGNQPPPCPQPAGSYLGNQPSSYPQPAGFSPGNQPPPCPQPAGSYPGNQPSSYPQPAGSYPGSQPFPYSQPDGSCPGNQFSPCPQPAGSYPGNQPAPYQQPGSYPGSQPPYQPQPAGSYPGNQLSPYQQPQAPCQQSMDYQPPVTNSAKVFVSKNLLLNPPIPLTVQIPKAEICKDMMVSIRGAPHQTCSRFTINMKHGSGHNSDILLHFDVRMAGNTNQIVRNSFQKGKWGREDTSLTYFPFLPNVVFNMDILINFHEFKIKVNKEHVTNFRLSGLPDKVDTLCVTGDIRVEEVKFTSVSKFDEMDDFH